MIKLLDWVQIGLALFLLAVVAAAGAKWGLTFGEAKIARLELTHARQERTAAEAALTNLQAAQARADALTVRLAAAERSRQSLALEHAREIKRLSTGRPCLAAELVRLLNQSAGAGADAVPAPTGKPVAADAGAASDTDVAEWADLARRQYDTCRDRIQAVIDWHQEPARD